MTGSLEVACPFLVSVSCVPFILTALNIFDQIQDPQDTATEYT
jgi:hypothetical protein